MFYNKYYKYKTKYNELKKQIGGINNDVYVEFHEYLLNGDSDDENGRRGHRIEVVNSNRNKQSETIKAEEQQVEIEETQVIKVAQETEPLCSACENDCPICLDPIDINTIFTTLCKHSFHIKCIYPMFDEAVKTYSSKPKISCPLCRADVFIKAKLSLMEVTHY
jgi:hypothetical protein